jgi:hypothetical protein
VRNLAQNTFQGKKSYAAFALADQVHLVASSISSVARSRLFWFALAHLAQAPADKTASRSVSATANPRALPACSEPLRNSNMAPSFVCRFWTAARRLFPVAGRAHPWIRKPEAARKAG